MSEENKVQVRTQADRPKREARVPFGVARSKLSVEMELEGYHLHWVNDTPGRIHDAQRGGYAFVKPSEIGIEGTDTQVKRLVGTNEDGSSLYAYLMKIELQYYEEDQKVIQSQVDQFDRAIKAGKLEEKAGDNRYNAGIKIS